MTKYSILLVVLIAAGGGFLFMVQNTEAPTPTPPPPAQENPFGDGANVVGPLEGTTSTTTQNNPSAPPPPAPTPTPPQPTAGVITRTQLAAHNMQSDCWIAYKGIVYDLTSWIPRHPGGATAISRYCGKAEEFEAAFSKQHGTSKDKRLEKEGVKQGTLGN
jgi:hypothetical protein